MVLCRGTFVTEHVLRAFVPELWYLSRSIWSPPRLRRNFDEKQCFQSHAGC